MLERGVHILQAFRPQGGTLSLATLIERTGLPKPTVHRIAEELRELGLLERQPVGYRLGLGLFELGELVPAKADLREIAEYRVREMSGLPAFLAGPAARLVVTSAVFYAKRIDKNRRRRHLTGQLEALGYRVTLEELPMAA